MEKEIDSNLYISIVGESSKRTRTALIIVTVISAYWGFGLWNETQGGGLEEHLRISQLALGCFEQFHSTAVQDNNLTGAENDASPNPGLKRRISSQTRLEVCEDPMVESFFLEKNNFYLDKKFLSDYVLDLQKESLHNSLTINLPPFGVPIDIKNSGHLVGITLVISMMFLRFSIKREGENLACALRAARRRGCLASYAEILRMKQVLFISAKGRLDRLWKYLPVSLFCLPVVVQFIALRIAFRNLTLQSSAHEHLGWYTVNGFLFLLVILLAASCWGVSNEMDSEWDNVSTVEDEESLNIETTWKYQTTEAGPSETKHSGECRVFRNEAGRIEIHGERFDADPDDGLGKVDKVTWRSSFASYDEGLLRFEYEVKVGFQAASIVGYCTVAVGPENGDLNTLKGQYYELRRIPVSQRKYGEIVLSRT